MLNFEIIYLALISRFHIIIVPDDLVYIAAAVVQTASFLCSSVFPYISSPIWTIELATSHPIMIYKLWWGLLLPTPRAPTGPGNMILQRSRNSRMVL